MPSSSIDVHAIQNVRCLVVGAGGFIGTALCETLQTYGAQVYGFGREPRFPSVFEDINFIKGDFLAPSCLKEATKNIDVVFHLISTTLPASSNKRKLFDVESNLLGTIKLLECCLDNDVKKVVFISSGGTVYGSCNASSIDESQPTNPICSYGIVKLAIEKYLSLFHHLHGLDYAVLRVSNPFGPFQIAQNNQGIIATIFSRAITNQPFTVWGDGTIIRDYIYIYDVVDAMVRAALYSGSYQLFNVGSNLGRSILNLIQEIQLITDKNIDIHFEAGRSVDIPRNVLANDLICQELGWLPAVDFSDGLQKTYDWLTQRI
ncbi:nad-dependent epimerase dehydratase [Leptolyngbya sp. Heron Island J]|uniref:NAD-dependent epimerase/dehydratase family protein n=1 Tax=Leptolyngbya sp. Heron Island J TaxID=1385935 RepID=UPI0003B9476C|nr:NAD-dependent epimerase/dehydratase family protein [Leptolyngbya sp. Heron Island J]ESA33020.1 nad-dependent epimerase dehydratase [Leptolyngbya sp. Heron Island J]